MMYQPIDPESTPENVESTSAWVKNTAEAQQHQPVPTGPRQRVQPGRDVRGDRPGRALRHPRLLTRVR
jgi:hypothetical protein